MLAFLRTLLSNHDVGSKTSAWSGIDLWNTLNDA